MASNVDRDLRVPKSVEIDSASAADATSACHLLHSSLKMRGRFNMMRYAASKEGITWSFPTKVGFRATTFFMCSRASAALPNSAAAAP